MLDGGGHLARLGLPRAEAEEGHRVPGGELHGLGDGHSDEPCSGIPTKVELTNDAINNLVLSIDYDKLS